MIQEFPKIRGPNMDLKQQGSAGSYYKEADRRTAIYRNSHAGTRTKAIGGPMSSASQLGVYIYIYIYIYIYHLHYMV